MISYYTMHNGIISIIDIVLYGSVASIIAIRITLFIKYHQSHLSKKFEWGRTKFSFHFDDGDQALCLKLSLDLDPKSYKNHKRLSGQHFNTI